MQNLFAISLTISIMMFSSLSFSQDVKVGVVNIALLLEKAPQAKAASLTLEREFAPQQTELTTLAKEMDKKQKDYQRNKLVLSETQRQSAQREIGLLSRDIQRKKNDIQELVNIRRNEELASLQGIVNKGIKEIGKQDGFDLILYEGIAYTNDRIDVTQKVLNFLDEQYRKNRTDFNQ